LILHALERTQGMNTTLNTITVPRNVTISYVTVEDNMMVRHMEVTTLVREVMAAVTRWYYTNMVG
jgi:hypothetical protein